MRTRRWACCVTTVPERRETLLPATLASLAAAGFSDPWVFVDGHRGPWKELKQATYRSPKVGAWGSWHLAVLEMHLRDPLAERYAVFQDDLEARSDLRQFLDRYQYPDDGYWNLLTYPENEAIIKSGWGLTNQKGRGATALVFDRAGILHILSALSAAEKPRNAFSGSKNIDGAVVTAMKFVGRKEYCHVPSLIQHTGDTSTLGNRVLPRSATYVRGPVESSP